MSRDFFIKVTFAAHKVASALPEEETLRFSVQEIANSLLEKLIFLLRESPVPSEEKLRLNSEAIKDLELLEQYFAYLQHRQWINPENFLMLGREYNKIKELLEQHRMQIEQAPTPLVHEQQMPVSAPMQNAPVPSTFEEFQKESTEVSSDRPGRHKDTPGETPARPGPVTVSKADLPARQQKILELLKGKASVQVQELQKALPQVTKRTLRRDLDQLLRLQLVERSGEWNKIGYTLRK